MIKIGIDIKSRIIDIGSLVIDSHGGASEADPDYIHLCKC